MKSNLEFELSKLKEECFRETVKKTAKTFGLKFTPTVKIWDGVCPYGSGNEIAHAHPKIRLICISRGNLEGLSLEDVEQTAVHETTHMRHLDHGSGFVTDMEDAQLTSWLISHKPSQVTIKSKIRATPEIDKLRCNYHLCRKKTKLFKCKHCENYYCKEHKEPKLVLTLHYINTQHEPLRSQLYEIYKSESGHPDVIFTKEHWEDLKFQKEEHEKKIWDALNKMGNISEQGNKHRPNYRQVPIKKSSERKNLMIGIFISLAIIFVGVFIFNNDFSIQSPTELSLAQIANNLTQYENQMVKVNGTVKIFYAPLYNRTTYYLIQGQNDIRLISNKNLNTLADGSIHFFVGKLTIVEKVISIILQ